MYFNSERQARDRYGIPPDASAVVVFNVQLDGIFAFAARLNEVKRFFDTYAGAIFLAHK